jgi:quaternary ammonium compound-resistance protein SugE
VSWVILICAGLLEVVWAFAMKQSDGFTKPIPALVTVVAMVASVGLLAISMRTLPLGTAYVIWTGIGAVGAFLVGITFLDEQVNAPRVVAAVLIVVGLVVMKASTPE